MNVKLVAALVFCGLLKTRDVRTVHQVSVFENQANGSGVRAFP